MTEIKERVYYDRGPRVGDTIECTHTNGSSFNGYMKGDELIISSVETAIGECVFAHNKRTGFVVCIHDSRYRIYRDITKLKTGEQHVVKRIFGIPFYKKTIEIYEEV